MRQGTSKGRPDSRKAGNTLERIITNEIPEEREGTEGRGEGTTAKVRSDGFVY